ncbi:MAG TPA: Mur ligase family protein [bacterium]|nr:Mur ligase family protein [bacterium]
MNFTEYSKAVHFLESLGNIRDKKTLAINFTFKKSEHLIKELKINLNQFKFIHIAGTSGKGSVTAMTHNILAAEGKRVGSLYSPHTTTMIERIKVGDKYISPDNFVRLLNRVKPAWEKIYWRDKRLRPNFGAIILAISLLYFEEKKCEYVVLEAFVGGENDATNIIKRPKITVITNIGVDHTKTLGKTLKEIANAKAGIIKPGAVVLTTEKNKHLLKIFQERAKKSKAKFFDITGQEVFKLGMNGSRQNGNAKLVAKIGEILKIEPLAIQRGIEKTTLPCRLEIMSGQPLVILDGAHNPDKIKSTVESLKSFDYRRLVLVFALNENKDEKKIVKMIAPVANKVFITRHLNNSRTCVDLKLLYNLFLANNKKLKAEIKIDPWQALEAALQEAGKDDLVLITGSFFLAGELRKKWISEEKILRDNS